MHLIKLPYILRDIKVWRAGPTGYYIRHSRVAAVQLKILGDMLKEMEDRKVKYHAEILALCRDLGMDAETMEKEIKNDSLEDLLFLKELLQDTKKLGHIPGLDEFHSDFLKKMRS